MKSGSKLLKTPLYNKMMEPRCNPPHNKPCQPH